MRYLKKEQRRPGWGWSVPFFLVLGVLSVVSFIIPLRPAQSYMEKRNLAQFPDFAVEALLSGDYFDDISLWFSDTFPGREGWLELSSYTQSFHGYSEVSIQGDLPPVEDMELLARETEPLTEPPAPTVPAETETVAPETQASTEPVETEPVQTEPLPTEPAETEPPQWGGVQVNEEDIFFTGSIIQIGDAVFSALGSSQVYSDKYISAINDFAEAVKEKGVTVVSAPCPTSLGIMVEPEFQKELKSASQTETLGYLHSGMNENVVKVDTVSALLPHNNEYIYFRTDHHWTALGAYYSYRAMCEAVGMEPVELDSLETWDQGEFVGSLYSSARYPRKLRKDNVVAYVPKGDIVDTVFDSNNSIMGRQIPILSDTTQKNKGSKYLVFGADCPLTHAENRSLPDAPNVLIIKDSFGNCMVPFLTQNFHNVYAADYRTYRKMKLVDFVDEYDIDYVIFMPYMTATQSGEGVLLLKNVIEFKP